MKQKFKQIMSSWVLTDNAIKYGGIIKKKILLSEIKNIVFYRAETPKRTDEYTLGHIVLYRLSPEENVHHKSKLTGNYVLKDEGIYLSYRNNQSKEAKEAVYYIIEHSGISEEWKSEIIESKLRIITGGSVSPGDLPKPSKNNDKKDASVVGRAVVGGIVAGPVGAVVGAISAADKNNKNKE